MRTFARFIVRVSAPIGLVMLGIAVGCADTSDRSIAVASATAPEASAKIVASTTPLATTGAGSTTAAEVNVVDDSVDPSASAVLAGDPLLEPARVELLRIAWDAASAMPIDPFLKDRSRAQQRVVETCLELGQADYARRSLTGIENWRRGIALAELAFLLIEREREGFDAASARNGENLERVRGYLVTALAIAERAEDWRRDRIRVRVARAYALLGEIETARALEKGVVESEAGRVDDVIARSEDPAAFDEAISSFEAAVATGSFELTRNALVGATDLHDRHYDDVARRGRLETLIVGSWDKTPFAIRIELLERLAANALAHGDPIHARSFVDRATEIVDGQRWAAENEVPIRGRLAGLRRRTGDAEGARAAVDAALALFEERRRTIANLFRAEALLPVCEALVAMDDPEGARALYARAIEESLDNPNSRPRAADLVAIACSMVTADLAIDEATLARMRGIRDELSAPW